MAGGAQRFCASADLVVNISGVNPLEPWFETTPHRVLVDTDPAFTQRYFFQTRVEANWQSGAAIKYWTRDGQLAVEGEVLETDPPRRLVTTWAFRSAADTRDDPPSRVTWEIEPLGEMCRLTLVHDDFPSETATFKRVGGGWPLVLSSLKSLLETGEPLPSMRQ